MSDEILTPLPRPWEGQSPPNAHPPEVREAATRLALELRNSTEAARRLGIDKNLIQGWVAQAIIENGADWNAHQIQAIESKVEQILARIEPDKLEKAGLKDLLIGMGILLDKRALLLPKGRNTVTSRLRVKWKGGEGAVELETSGE